MNTRTKLIRIRVVCLSLACLLFLSCAGAETSVQRILIVGDSWAASIATVQHDGPGFGSFDAVLADHRLSGYKTQGAKTAWGGRKASDWVKPSYLAILDQELYDYPTIDIVHLVIGGNDFLGKVGDGVNIMSYTPAQRAAFWDAIETDIQTLIDHCLAVRPEIRVLISDYDYLDPAKAQSYPGSPFNFGGATPRQLNEAFIELGQRKLAIARRTPRCAYVSNWGVLQHYFEDPAPGLPLPGVAPDYVPYAGGDLDAGMPLAAHVGDGIHPTDPGHRYVIERCVAQFYEDWLTKSGVQPDSDSDGLLDRDEIRDLDVIAPGVQNPFDPFNPDATSDSGVNAPDGTPDGQNDYDGDGTSNAVEFSLGTNPLVADGPVPATAPAAQIILALGLLCAGLCRFPFTARRVHQLD